MDRSELQFTLADMICAMLLLAAIIGFLVAHADEAHFIWYYLPVLLVCEAVVAIHSTFAESLESGDSGNAVFN